MDLRKSILESTLERTPVTVAEWQGVTVYVSTMDGHRRSQWADAAFDTEGKIKEPSREILLVHTLEDEVGQPIFTATDVDALNKKHASVLSKLFVIAKNLNGLGSDEVEVAEKK